MKGKRYSTEDSYVGIRAEEDRSGYISTKPNIKPTFPFKEDGIGYAGVIKMLEDSGIGMPPYLKWGRSHFGVFDVEHAAAFATVEDVTTFHSSDFLSEAMSPELLT